MLKNEQIIICCVRDGQIYLFVCYYFKNILKLKFDSIQAINVKTSVCLYLLVVKAVLMLCFVILHFLCLRTLLCACFSIINVLNMSAKIVCKEFMVSFMTGALSSILYCITSLCVFILT